MCLATGFVPDLPITTCWRNDMERGDLLREFAWQDSPNHSPEQIERFVAAVLVAYPDDLEADLVVRLRRIALTRPEEN